MKLLKELLEELDLLESPQRIAALRLHQLEDIKQNKKLTKLITLWTPNAKVLETLAGDVKLYHQIKGKENEIYAIDEESKQILYFVRYEIQSASFIDTDWVTQVLVWRGTFLSYKTKGLAEYIFNKYVLPITGTVVSDGEQTTDGERFWKQRISDSFANHNLKIYLLNFNDKTVVKFKNLNDYQVLLNTRNDPWGSRAYNKGVRIAISNHDFTQE